MGFITNFLTGGAAEGLSGIGGFLGGVGQLFGIGRPSIEKQLEVSKEMAKYEHDLSMDAWREQVAYNDPSRQAERLEAAGFSKHNLVGNASINGNATGVPAASVDTPDLSKFQKGMNLQGFSTALNSFYDAKIKKEQARLLSNQADNLFVDTQKKTAEKMKTLSDKEMNNVHKGLLETEKKIKDLEYDLRNDSFHGDKSMRRATLDKMIAEFTHFANENELHEFKYNALEFEDSLRKIGVNPNNANPITSIIATLVNKTLEVNGISGIDELINHIKKWFGFSTENALDLVTDIPGINLR